MKLQYIDLHVQQLQVRLLPLLFFGVGGGGGVGVGVGVGGWGWEGVALFVLWFFFQSKLWPFVMINISYNKWLHIHLNHFLKGGMCPPFLPPAPAWVNI